MKMPSFPVFIVATFCLASSLWAASPNIVISQIYGGGGNIDSLYKNDFIELFNRGTEAVDLSGWSVQYASTSGTTWNNRTNLSGTLEPGQYYLVQGAMGTGDAPLLPTPDATGTINLSGTNGKVAVVNSTDALSGSNPDPGTYVDFVGYGTANYFEGTAAAPTASNSLAVIRLDEGCQDTDENGDDFTTGEPTPRNTASPFHTCTSTPTFDIVLTAVALESPTELRIEGTVGEDATLTLEYSTALSDWMPELAVAPKVVTAGNFTFLAPVTGDARYYRVSALLTTVLVP